MDCTHFICRGVVSATPRSTFVLCQNAANPFSVRFALESSARAILPISVSIAVAVMTTLARPLVTCEPE